MKIVFDFAGVLFQWQPQRLLRREIPHAAHDDVSAAQWVRHFFQGFEGDWGDFDRGTVGVADLVARIAARTGLAVPEVQQVVDGVPRELQPVADTVTLLRRLRDEGHELYFLSNMPAPYADHLERQHDFLGWFRDGLFSARVNLAKPDPAIFALAAQRFGAAPAALVFLDDHEPNVQAARAAGWAAIHFTGAAEAEAALRALAAQA
jgi:putative hydrolase of the HAD superfamily